MDPIRTIKLNENTMSLILSGAAVVMVGLLLFNYFRSVNKLPGQTSSLNTEETEDGSSNFYLVREGDTLWSIAEAKYGSGFKWGELYAANQEAIADPNLIESGMKIRLVGQKRANTIDGTYTVEQGDNLWQIAEEKCGDGYAWTKIANDNNLANPDTIHAGNRFVIRCQ